MTGREFAEKYNEAQLKEIARDISESITIRSYNRDGSRDDRRKTTKVEREIIRNIAYGAMLAYSDRSYADDVDGGLIDSILDMAEFTLMQFIPEANTYDTIYIPLRNVTETR